MTEVAVAIVHFDAAQLMDECLVRLEASSLTNFRAVVVNNGGRAGRTRQIASDRVEIIDPGRNLGFAAGVNLALDILPCDSPYVLLLNPDVQLETDTLEKLVDALEAQADVGAASCALRLLDGRLDPACRRAEPTAFDALAKQLGLQRLFPSVARFGRYNMTFVDADRPHDVDSGTGALLLVRREALEAAGGRLDERFFLYGEDLDLCRRIREAGYRIRYWPHAKAVHIKGSGRIRPPAVTVQFYRAMWTYYRKWGRYRRNPLVLSGLACGLVALGTAELVRNSVRRHLAPRSR